MCDDADLDSVCDDADVCAGFDDKLDTDDDGTPDGCDGPARDLENCGDGVDNDADEAIDCGDADCANHASCAGSLRFTALVGTVVDTSDVPLPNVRVQVGLDVTLTDDGGHFVMPGLSVPDRPLPSTFELAGYGSSARLVQLIPDHVVYIRVVLKAVEVVAESQDPVVGFTVRIGSRVTVVFPPDSLLDEDGAPITDLVDVEIVTGDPTNPLDAPVMPGDYLSDENGGTPLDSVAFVGITARTENGEEVDRVNPDAPVVVEMRIPASLEQSITDTTIPWWRFDASIGFWRRAGAATFFAVQTPTPQPIVFMRGNLTNLGWWNCDRPIEEHACVCIDVVDGAGDPIGAAQLVAQGVTYSGTSTPVSTDDSGRACVTVKNSATSPQQVNLSLQLGLASVPYTGNPVDTPTVAASCLRDIDCPEKCEVLPGPIPLDRSGLVSGTVTARSGTIVRDLPVLTDHDSFMTTDENGRYSLPVFLDIPFTVFAVGYTSPDLVASTVVPEVAHDIALANLPPQLVDLSANGVAQAISSQARTFQHLAVLADESVPVQFDAFAVDGDGDSITYTWSGACNEGGGSLSCDPPDAPSTTCDPPAPDLICEYSLLLDDGYVPQPVEWVIDFEAWAPRPGRIRGTVTSQRSGAPAGYLLVWTDDGFSTRTDGAGAYSLPVPFDMPVTVSMDGYTSPLLAATVAAPQVVHDIALANVPPRIYDLRVNNAPQAACAGYQEYCSVQVADAGAPVLFVASVVDADGDPIAYTWSGSCDGATGWIPLSCDPPDASNPTCDPPDSTCAQGRYYLGLDDGYASVNRTIFLSEAP